MVPSAIYQEKIFTEIDSWSPKTINEQQFHIDHHFQLDIEIINGKLNNIKRRIANIARDGRFLSMLLYIKKLKNVTILVLYHVVPLSYQA